MLEQYIQKLQNLSDYSFIVTAGPTREWLDPFRFISNPSSGKMGIAFADAARTVSGRVTLVHGPVSDKLLDGKEYRKLLVETTEQMRDAVLSLITDNTVLIMAAAPADFTPIEKKQHKIKKGGEPITLLLHSTPDILKCVDRYISERKLQNIIRIGFAAETEELHHYAKKKLREKGLDFICLNDIAQKGAGFAGDTNEIVLFHRSGTEKHFPMDNKTKLAYRILAEIAP